MNIQSAEPVPGGDLSQNDQILITTNNVGRLAPASFSTDDPPGTTPGLWFIAYIVIMVLAAARIPTVLGEAASKIPEDVKSELGDERLLSLSTTVGGILFVLTYALVMALYLWLTAFLDKRLVRSKASVGRLKFGPFFAIAVLSTIPVHLVSFLTHIPDARSIPGFYMYFPVAVAAVLVAFRSHWSNLPGSRKIVVILVGAAVPLLAVLG